MSNAFAIEENYRETGVRQGNPIGGHYDPSSDDFTTWTRLMPSGATATAVTDETVDNHNEKLTIGTLRSDITNAPIGGWLLNVLKAGYQELYQIRSYDSGVVHLARLYRENTEMTLQHIPGNIAFVIFPTVIVDFRLNNHSGDDLEIGFQPQDIWSSDGVQPLGIVGSGQVFGLPNQRIDRLMFKGNNVDFSWGEHYIA